MASREQLEREIERHERAAERAAERLAELEARPEEPELEDGSPVVLRFQAQFMPGGRVYDYAAIGCPDRLGDGARWYTTGPHSPKDYSWEQLMSWLEPKLIGNIWIVYGYEEL